MTLTEAFLIGVIATMCLTASLFFLKFWKDSHDSFFLAFAASFLIEGLNRIAVLAVVHPNEGSPGIYLVRLAAFLLILIAILRKNYKRM